MRYCFQPVFVTRRAPTARRSGDEAIRETVTLSFGAVSETYTKQSPGASVLLVLELDHERRLDDQPGDRQRPRQSRL